MISGSLTGRMEASSKNKALASVSLGKGLLYCFQFAGMLLHQRKSISVQFQNQFADVKPQDFTGFPKGGQKKPSPSQLIRSFALHLRGDHGRAGRDAARHEDHPGPGEHPVPVHPRGRIG